MEKQALELEGTETENDNDNDEEEAEVLLYQNFSSSPDVSFWKELARRKLDVLGLNDAAIPVTATFRVTSSRSVGVHAEAEADAAGHASAPFLLELSASSFAQRESEGLAREFVAGETHGDGDVRGGSGASRLEEGEGGDGIPSVFDAARVPGLLYNFNTVEAFKRADKGQILRDCMRPRLERIASAGAPSEDEAGAAQGRVGAFQDPETLAQFVVLGYADLKKHTFVYWFGFPTLKLERSLLPRVIRPPRSMGAGSVFSLLASEVPDPDARCSLAAQLAVLRNAPHSVNLGKSDEPIDSIVNGRWTVPLYFVVLVEKNGEGVQSAAPKMTVRSIAELPRLLQTVDATKVEVALGCMDPSSSLRASSWPVRNLLHWIQLAQLRWPTPPAVAGATSGVRVLCIRDAISPDSRLFNSVILRVVLPTVPRLFIQTEPQNGDALDSSSAVQATFPTFFGWEPDHKGRPRPRKVNLASQMDPMILMSTAVDLNLKLMRWRMLPQLNTDKLAATKCLLVGAGTLGCAVARTLLGWGIRHISFVDCGRVTYSNPCRQSLFEYEDARQQKPKAAAAAAAVSRIFPSAVTAGHDIRVPMPGHGIGGAEGTPADKAVAEAVSRLDALVEAHDVVFLLTDTRESRWLPSLLALQRNRLVINSALGFDTYLVMRHGVDAPAKAPTNLQSQSSVKSAEGHAPNDYQQLGCYYCNDVVAPANSTINRTLDQQCTVSRPALAMIAGALAVELLVVLLHHPQGAAAPADTAQELSFRPASPLGLVPHQIRGYLSHHKVLLPHAHAFPQCSCCSSTIRKLYRDEGFAFLRRVFNDPSYLEEASGLAALQAEANTTNWDDVDLDFDSD